MKKITTKNDLAINGAPPAFEHPLHVGQPNIKNERKFLEAASEILASRYLTNNGPQVQALESKISEKIGVKHCIAVTNATIGIELVLRALEVQGEVIVPSWTFIATAQVVSWLGLKPTFADINERYQTIDPDDVQKKITKRTGAILATHIWGNGCEVEKLTKIAKENNLPLLFDAAHAFNCTYKNHFIGGFGDAEIFSFHATKFFNTFEGGAITTNNDELAFKLRKMRNFGFNGYDNVEELGTNAKMSEIHAAMGLANLEAIEEITEKNEENYRIYREMIGSIPGLQIMEYNKEEKLNYQYIVVTVDPIFPKNRDQIVETLHKENILARKYFWPGCHRMKYYSSRNINQQTLPKTEIVSDRNIVLPTGSSVGKKEIALIVDVLRILGSATE